LITLICRQWRCLVGSRNEYDQLKTVIIGTAEHATRPPPSTELHTVCYSDRKDISNLSWGPFPKHIIIQANEDLDRLCKMLESLGIKVLRPYSCQVQYYNFCPRDTIIVNDDVAIPAPMALTCRRGEYVNIAQHFKNVANVVSRHDNSVYNKRAIGNADVLALHETFPVFDAANVIRSNNDWLYLVSNTGNRKGAEYLQEIVGTSIKVHLLENVYSYAHIDSTIAFLKEGLLMANPSRISSKDQLPGPFKNWDVIFAPTPVDIGHWPDICMSSPWINVNLLSINERLVVLEENQIETARLLSGHGIDSIMLPMRHSRTMGGCFHCVSLDVDRGDDV